MSAYIIASYDIVDKEGYADYMQGVGPLLEKHGAEIVVADKNAETLEGDQRSIFVVLRFQSEEAALGWYNDPAYEPLKKMRIDASANASLVLGHQFVLP